MLRQFNQVTPFSFFLLFIYFAVLSIHFFIEPIAIYNQNNAPIEGYLFQITHLISQQTLLCITLLLVFCQGILVCFFVHHCKLIPKFSLVPAITYFLFCFLFDDFIILSPLLLVNFLCIWLLFKLVNCYNLVQADSQLFAIGLLQGFAFLLYFPSCILLLFNSYALFKLRSTSFREFIVFCCGACILLFLTFTAYFWFDRLDVFWKFFTMPQSLPDFSKLVNAILIIKLIFGALFIGGASWFLNTKYVANPIQIRKYLTVIVYCLFFTLISILLSTSIQMHNLLLTGLPASIIVSYFFINSKNKEAAEILHIIFFGSLLFFQHVNFV